MKQSIIYRLGQIPYYVRPRVEITLAQYPQCENGRIIPAIVLNVQEPTVSLRDVKAALLRFEKLDDVYSSDFLKGGLMLLQILGATRPTPSIPAELDEFFRTRSTALLFTDAQRAIPNGPYFANGTHLHQAWRLYEDTLSAFVSSAIPRDTSNENDNLKMDPLPLAADSGLNSVVAVPSRLYSTTTADEPLAGMRISIKDNMHISGLVTTLGSRSYTAFEGVQKVTSGYVALLAQKGAVVVGKTKLSAWAGSEVPANQCIDYFPPWNPRGDGYQGPSGSSSGAGASTAGYGWLDASLCTDTTGSMRFPASSHGVWGHRVSWDTVSMSGIVPSVPIFDTIGLLSRTPQTIQEILSVHRDPADLTLPFSAYSKELPNRILYPTDWYPQRDAGQQKMTELFVDALERFLGVQRINISLTEEWQRTAPESLRHVTPKEYLAKSLYWVHNYHVYHTFDSFREGYQAKFGSPPYVSPSHKQRWANGSRISKKERDQGAYECSVFRIWVREKVLQVDERGISRTVILVPHGRPGANYRDQDMAPPEDNEPISSSYNAIAFGSMAQIPQVVVPRSDQMLLRVAYDALSQAGWPTEALAGRFMFDIGDNDRHAQVAIDDST